MTAMRLDRLLDGIATPAQGDIVVSGLTQDSHAVRAGDAFFALAGAQHHGIEFAPDAVEQGAVVVLAEKRGPGTGDRGPAEAQEQQQQPSGTRDEGSAKAQEQQQQPSGTRDEGSAEAAQVPASGPRSPVLGPLVWIENLRAHLGDIAARFYRDPSAQLTVIGVTGTNGKTSTVQLLAQALAHVGRRAATIGTLGAGLHGAIATGERTTPDVIRVHGLMAGFRDAGATDVAMEVSSHALAQHRVDGVHFDVAVFTNLTRDHLDYHGSMQAYGAAKAKLFAWPGLHAAVVNVDDAFGGELAARIRERRDRQAAAAPRLLRYATGDADAEVRAVNVHTHSDGTDFELVTPWGSQLVYSRLLGRFNVANMLAVAATLGALEIPFERICAALDELQPVDGRMSRVGGGAVPLVVVDYAHTPDALEQALATLREHCEGRLICVFGCGGDRDAGKRPEMGAIAAHLADVAIVTDDNPRSEDGDAIVRQILAGMPEPAAATVERDRARAIALAIAQAGAGDVVLVAGKGHEAYQESGGVRRAFDDLKVARATLEARAC